MNLSNTEKFMRQKMEEKCLDTYAILVRKGDEKAQITSENANADTYFDMASCGKVLVTSTLILKAIGEGKLALEDPLEKFYPFAPTDKRGITVKQLLTHTSGLVVQEFYEEEFYQSENDVFAERVLQSKLLFEPGSDYNYSSFGYLLLGYILEKIYGKRLDAIFEEKLKKPLGMTRSRFHLPAEVENAAVCYRTRYKNSWVDDETISRIKDEIGGIGAQFFTAEDVSLELDAILAKSALLYPEELFTLAEQDYTPDYAEGRGLGYWIPDQRLFPGEELFTEKSFGHYGSTGTSFFIDREKKLYVIVLTNARRFLESPSGEYNLYTGRMNVLRREIHSAVKKDLVEQGIL